MRIAIIDADIIGKKQHRFPNLACMKISSFYKSQGHEVSLKTDYENLEEYDKVFISKVFIDTEIPGESSDKKLKTIDNIIEWYAGNDFLKQPNIEYGGTGFYYKEAPSLPYEIEHCMPDYHLYDSWIEDCIERGSKSEAFKYYRDYSIGFLTRGCFRGCKFCVNENYKRCESHSDVVEFYDSNRPKLCFLDDNFFACPNWKNIITEIKELGVPFQFKQGLDERLLTDGHIHEMMSWKYDGAFLFAFDNINDSVLIEKNLKRIFKLYPTSKKNLKFYVFCGFDYNGVYDENFWVNDVKSVFERCFILAKYSALPYIMRFEKVYSSEYAGLYSVLASWCNQPSFFKKMSFREFSINSGMNRKKYKEYKQCPEKYIADGYYKGSCWRYMEDFESKYPALADAYFDISGDSLLEFGNGRKQRGGSL